MAVGNLYPSATQSLHCDAGSHFSVLSYRQLSYSLVPHYGTDPKSTEAFLWLQCFLDQADSPAQQHLAHWWLVWVSCCPKRVQKKMANNIWRQGQSVIEEIGSGHLKSTMKWKSNSSLKWFRNPLQGDAWLKICPAWLNKHTGDRPGKNRRRNAMKFQTKH